ncbi:2-oxo acid dehydrogenase subunit E2 [Haloactinomyces albus]|uniref:Pyruvate/2-oxoglutarate dehydrogenase complex dihydrolipoamide acyltransferase (E2) component n=1 Tax=Haloactinomyces albus TaxID=1352928 RepID=A0AAE3ZGJ9_9ACTN|nr:2-oxo acid dehydrogenase subunit E2 [Haloactinomyces albus]MDR7303660.1 pyruvate/2-oxoglutarate dehydrogenase complex dihydrolipoamide acyltransferase (E2) component [Haloactinomyces albus]
MANPDTTGESPTITTIARERRHTLNFLKEIRSFSPVFLDTEVDMTAVQQHRNAAREAGERYSLVTYVLHAAARVLADHPEANAAIRGSARPRMAWHGAVNGKLTLDKTINGQRVVLATVLSGLESAEMAEIQRKIEPFRDGDPHTMPEFKPVRLLQRLPWPLDRLLYRLAARPLKRRGATLGTFAVTSLGHRPVDGFHSVGGTTITLGVGRVIDRPVVKDGKVDIAPVLRLNLAFDHRAIDGAEAADVLADLKENLENFRAPVTPADTRHTEPATNQTY